MKCVPTLPFACAATPTQPSLPQTYDGCVASNTFRLHVMGQAMATAVDKVYKLASPQPDVAGCYCLTTTRSQVQLFVRCCQAALC